MIPFQSMMVITYFFFFFGFLRLFFQICKYRTKPLQEASLWECDTEHWGRNTDRVADESGGQAETDGCQAGGHCHVLFQRNGRNVADSVSSWQYWSSLWYKGKIKSVLCLCPLKITRVTESLNWKVCWNRKKQLWDTVQECYYFVFKALKKNSL